MATNNAANVGYVQRFTAAAEAMTLLAKVVAEFDSRGLLVDPKAPHPFAGRAQIRVKGTPWTLTATGDLDTECIHVVLRRRHPPGWDGTLPSAVHEHLVDEDELEVFHDGAMLGVTCDLPFDWDFGMVGQRLEMMEDAAIALWRCANTPEAMGPA